MMRILERYPLSAAWFTAIVWVTFVVAMVGRT